MFQKRFLSQLHRPISNKKKGIDEAVKAYEKYKKNYCKRLYI